ncbi:MAG: discoidin domain-containing protein [Burkholderiales bacterium]|nr:discoidin domain-containing protein [Burkholderiales bacterium]
MKNRFAVARTLLTCCFLFFTCQQLAYADNSMPRLLDGFDTADEWKIQATDQVKANLRTISGDAGGTKAMCIDYDFNGVSGYASASRMMPIDFPEQFSFDLKIKGNGGRNHLQIKLVDASGENVWWQNKVDFLPPSEWQNFRIKKRHIDFAWGPGQDQGLRHTEKIELVIAAGKDGGKGSVCFSQLRFQEIDVKQNQISVPEVSASSDSRGAQHILNNKSTTGWRSDHNKSQTLTVDFKNSREFGGVILHWECKYFASQYSIQLSDDGQTWRTVRQVLDGNGGDDPLDLPESEARFLRVVLQDGPENHYVLKNIEIKDLAFGSSTNAFIQAVAKNGKRGLYPRGFMGEQTYWTILGINGGQASGLMGEDGTIEASKGGFSVEPFILDGKSVLSWADVKVSQSLQDDYLPLPSVKWKTKELTLEISSFATGTPSQSQILTRYTLQNLSRNPITRTLALAIRPFQVNPPAQFLNTTGGSSDIKHLEWKKPDVIVNGALGVRSLSKPTNFFSSSFDAGQISERLGEATELPEVPASHDKSGRASGALLYSLSLAAGESKSIILALPMTGVLEENSLVMESAEAHFSTLRELTIAEWKESLNRVKVRLPANQQSQFNVMRSALSHILISRDGPALQPGTRSYARSWIRDGAMMTEGLLRLGHKETASAFVEWYSRFQFANGKVPCCVDQRGADPVPENDSHGQIIFSIAELYRYSRDTEQLKRLWPHVEQSFAYMEQLRASEQNKKNEGTSYYGLMPASISHEGYSAKPMHSYWDDFWALRGYKDAVSMASILGKKDQILEMTQGRNAFETDLKRSIASSIKLHAIDFIPGAAELGDFDPTSATISLSPADAGNIIEPKILRNTFDRYWKNFVLRRDSDKNWDAYTPYELRTVSTFVRLGFPDRAQSALSYFYKDLRPAGWNQWAEVVGREYRKERFIGDMPHAWISSDYIRSFLDVFTFEEERNQSITLAAGVPDSWLLGDGIAITDLRTSYGLLGYHLRMTNKELILKVSGGIDIPPGGVYYRTNIQNQAGISGDGWSHDKGVLKIWKLPANVHILRGGSGKKNFCKAGELKCSFRKINP